VFVDTAYWMALVLHDDPWTTAAERATALVADTHLVTTEEVLTEFLAGVSRAGKQTRRRAAEMVRHVLGSPNVSVVPQSHDTFVAGLELYQTRLDKQYSLTDCISMNMMKRSGLTEALTTDHHFTQRGCSILLTVRC
jgi:predicted nucleic acid-binding protein